MLSVKEWLYSMQAPGRIIISCYMQTQDVILALFEGLLFFIEQDQFLDFLGTFGVGPKRRHPLHDPRSYKVDSVRIKKYDSLGHAT